MDLLFSPAEEPFFRRCCFRRVWSGECVSDDVSLWLRNRFYYRKDQMLRNLYPLLISHAPLKEHLVPLLLPPLSIYDSFCQFMIFYSKFIFINFCRNHKCLWNIDVTLQIIFHPKRERKWGLVLQPVFLYFYKINYIYIYIIIKLFLYIIIKFLITVILYFIKSYLNWKFVWLSASIIFSVST